MTTMGRLSLAGSVIALASCYAPRANEGVACSPAGECPAGQICDPATGRCARELADAGLADVPIDADVTRFVDDFERPDGAIGNGWIEKNPSVYSLARGEVVRVPTPTESYRDNMVHRPASEDLRDVEISVRVRFTASPPGYAQIFVRGQSETIAAPDAYDGYLLYVEGGLTDELVLGRQRGSVFVATLRRFTLAEPFDTTSSYRLTLRAAGNMPVSLHASVEREVGDQWIVIGETTAEDSASNRIKDPGTVGFAGNEVETYVYDEFRRVAL
jgi:hypothetical protein